MDVIDVIRRRRDAAEAKLDELNALLEALTRDDLSAKLEELTEEESSGPLPDFGRVVQTKPSANGHTRVRFPPTERARQIAGLLVAGPATTGQLGDRLSIHAAAVRGVIATYGEATEYHYFAGSGRGNQIRYSLTDAGRRELLPKS